MVVIKYGKILCLQEADRAARPVAYQDVDRNQVYV